MKNADTDDDNFAEIAVVSGIFSTFNALGFVIFLLYSQYLGKIFNEQNEIFLKRLMYCYLMIGKY